MEYAPGKGPWQRMNYSVAKESSTMFILEVRLITASFILLVCVGAWVGCTCVSMERQETDSLGRWASNTISSVFLRIDLSRFCTLVMDASLVDLWASGVLLSLSPQNYKQVLPGAAILQKFWGSNACFHACATNTWPTELSPQCLSILFLSYIYLFVCLLIGYVCIHAVVYLGKSWDILWVTSLLPPCRRWSGSQVI